MRSRDMSAAELARRAKVSRGVVSQWLSGTVKEMRSSTAHRVADALSVQTRWIVHGVGPKTTAHPRDLDAMSKDEIVALYRAHGLHDDPNPHGDVDKMRLFLEELGVGYTRSTDTNDHQDAEERRTHYANQGTPAYWAREEPVESPYAFATHAHGVVLSAGNGSVAWEHEEIDNSHAFRRDWLQKRGLNINNCRIVDVEGDSMAPYLNDGDVVLVDLSDTTIKSGDVYAIAVDGELRVKRLFRKYDGSIEIRSDNTSSLYLSETVTADSVEQLHVVGRVVWRGG